MLNHISLKKNVPLTLLPVLIVPFMNNGRRTDGSLQFATFDRQLLDQKRRAAAHPPIPYKWINKSLGV